jgi:hypothetical protein
MSYPKWVFSANENVTRENMRVYDENQRRVYARCEEIRPDYWQLGLRERYEIRKLVEKEMGVTL